RGLGRSLFVDVPFDAVPQIVFDIVSPALASSFGEHNDAALFVGESGAVPLFRFPGFHYRLGPFSWVLAGLGDLFLEFTLSDSVRLAEKIPRFKSRELPFESLFGFFSLTFLFR